MARILTCVQGHVWEVPAESAASATGVEILCPVCGSAVDREMESASEGSSAVLTGLRLAPIGEAETVAPGPDSVIAPPGKSGRQSVSAPNHGGWPSIPGYEVLEELGRGGMGVVLKARQTKLDRMVALKVLTPQTESDAAFAERFSREARALAKLAHPNIVTVHDFGQVEGQSYLVMEFIAGMNLRQKLRQGRLSLEEVMSVVAQLCEALQYAHDEGIIHRDIKPENILFDKHGRVRLADFGLAKLTARTTVDRTLTGPWQVMGTWNYMAPEQFENPLAVDHRADIYALGVVLYEMLTGDVPRARFPLPSERGSQAAALDGIVLRALAQEPARRYQQIREFKADLEAVVPQGIKARDIGVPSAAGGRLVALSEPVALPPNDGAAPMLSPIVGQTERRLRPVGLLIVAALCLICWPVGLASIIPLAIWLWLTVRQPEGKRLLRQRIDRGEKFVRAAARHTIGSISAWSIVCAAFGAFVTIQRALPAASHDGREYFIYESGPGKVAAVVFFAVLAFHLALPTGLRKSIPVWQSIVLLAAGAIVLIAAQSILSAYGNPPQPYIEASRWSVYAPAYVLLALGIVLIVLGCLKFRTAMQRPISAED